MIIFIVFPSFAPFFSLFFFTFLSSIFYFSLRFVSPPSSSSSSYSPPLLISSSHNASSSSLFLLLIHALSSSLTSSHFFLAFFFVHLTIYIAPLIDLVSRDHAVYRYSVLSPTVSLTYSPFPFVAVCRLSSHTVRTNLPPNRLPSKQLPSSRASLSLLRVDSSQVSFTYF